MHILKHFYLCYKISPLSFSVAAMYITTDICACAVSVLIQIMIMNMYHASEIRHVPGWLMTVTKCQNQIGAVNGQEDIKYSEGVDGQEGGNNDPQNPNDENHRTERRTLDARRESRIGVPKDLASVSIKNDWQRIARGCDVICFVSFLLFHMIFTVTIVSVLIKGENPVLCWNGWYPSDWKLTYGIWSHLFYIGTNVLRAGYS